MSFESKQTWGCVLTEGKQMGKILYVTDLDGTLLNRSDRISAYSLDTINQLVEDGMIFTYATARSLSSASVVTEGLTTRLPVIVYNGAFIVRTDTRERLAVNLFSGSQIQYIKELLAEHKINPLVYALIDGEEKVSRMAGTENEGTLRYLSLRQNDRRMRPLPPEEAPEHLYEGEVFYFTCIGEQEELEPVYKALKDHPEFRCTLQQELYRQEYWCEIMPKAATKANAIRQLKEILGCDQVVSFGDAVNDLPMFEISDRCYAVANAVEELKAEATAVIESNEEDAVARWLRKYVVTKS